MRTHRISNRAERERTFRTVKRMCSAVSDTWKRIHRMHVVLRIFVATDTLYSHITPFTDIRTPFD